MTPLSEALSALVKGATKGPWVDDDGVIQGATMRPVIIDPSALRGDITLICFLVTHARQIESALRLAEAVDRCGRDHKGMPVHGEHPCEDRIYSALMEYRKSAEEEV